MEFRLLGPLEVVDDSGRVVPLPNGRQRELLGLLLLRPNEPVASERIIDSLWGEGAPPTAAKMVHNQVSALRRVLGPNGRLETRGGAYQLNVAPEEEDRARFETLVARARALGELDPAGAAAVLREALGLWRGPALSDVAYEAFAQAEIARLEELRWAAFERCVNAELELGRHAELVPELERAAAEQPLRERLHAQLMLALYRSGRQAAALEAYLSARRTLVDEVGVEPGAELRQLHTAILAQDPKLDPPPALAPQLEGGSPLLAGRTEELAYLRARLDRSDGAVVTICGPAGMGKTRLAAELARGAARRGIAVHYATTGAAALAAAARDGPALLVVDPAGEIDREEIVAAARPRLMIVLLQRRPPGQGECLDLKPLDDQAVEEIAALYGVPPPVGTDGVPLAVHRAAAEAAHRRAAAHLAGSARRAAAERKDLRAAEIEVTGDVLALQEADEREQLLADVGAPLPAVCPFLGLATYDAAHARYFFGRERLVAELVARLAGASLLAVVGPSGSGKSSAVRAGLLPALQQGVLPGAERRAQATMRPGEHPRAALRAAVPATPAVLVVDQFEELFTACRDATERHAFADALADLADDPERGVLVVLAVRADFYGRCARYERLARLVGANQVLVGPMRRDELRRAIELPARAAGLTVEAALTAALVADVREEPGGLPLLSAALLELWRERDGRVLRLAAYQRSGGVRGAVARLAEEAYRGLDDPQRAAARRILVRLAHAGEENGAFVRRRVALDELDAERDEQAAALHALADGRLVTLDEGTAEVAHEALLREWPRLRAWLEEDAAGRRLHQHLIHAARDWDAAGREESELYRGARLASALDWLGEHEADLNERERTFLAASRAAAERESERQHQANRRLRVLIGGLACLLALAVVAGVVALDQRGAARQATVVADAQRLGAQAQNEARLDRALLLARAGVALDDTLATRSSLLSVLERNPAALGIVDHGWGLFTVAITRDSRLMALGDERGVVGIYNAATHQPVGHPYWIKGGLIQRVRFSPDGRTLAVGFNPDPGQDHVSAVVDLIDPRTQQRRRRIHLGPLPRGAGFGVALTEFVAGGDLDIEQIPAPYAPGLPASVVYHVDAETGAIRRSVPVGRHESKTFSVTADGRRVFITNQRDDTAWMLDATTLRVLRSYPLGADAGAVSADGRVFALGSPDGRVRLLNTRTRAVRAFAAGDGRPIGNMAFTPDGRKLVTAGDDDGGKLLVWDVRRGAVAETLTGHTQDAEPLDVSGDGRTLVSGSSDGRVIVYDLAGDRRLERPFPSGGPFNVDSTPRGIAVSRDGRTLAFTRSDGDVQLMNARTLRPERRLHALRGAAAAVAFSSDGRLMAVSGDGGQVTLWDARTLRRVAALRGLRIWDQTVAFSPHGKLLASADQADPRPTTLIWDVGARRPTAFRHTGNCPTDDCSASSIAFSPDGTELAEAQDIAGADIRDVRTGRLVKHLTTGGEARSVAFSPDGKLVFVGRFDGKGFMFSAATWQRVGRPLDADNARITYGAFTPDSRTLATADADGTVRLWDVATDKAIGGTIDFDVGTYPAAAFSPDGRYLYAISSTGEGIRVDMSPAVWIRHACQIAGREMTALEWHDALPGRPYRRLCAS